MLYTNATFKNFKETAATWRFKNSKVVHFASKPVFIDHFQMVSFYFTRAPGSTLESGRDDYRIRGLHAARSAMQVYTLRHELLMVFREITADFIGNNFLSPHDKMMVRMVHLPTGHSRSTRLVFVNQWDVEQFLNMIEDSIQSNDMIDPENTVFQFMFVKGTLVGKYFTASDDVEAFIRSKRCIVRISNVEDDLCFFRCLALAFGARDGRYDEVRQSAPVQRREARALFLESGRQTRGYEHVSVDDCPELAQLFQVHIVIISVDQLEMVCNTGSEYTTRLVMLYVPGEIAHFHYVRSEQTGALWNKNNFCYQCMHAYIRRPHLCRGSCIGCGSMECEGRRQHLSEFPLRCEYCNLSCYNAECLHYHLKNYVCEKGQRCTECDVFFPAFREFTRHKCGFRKCKQCNELVPYEDEHECYIQNLPDEPAEPSRYIFYDYETYVDNGLHKVALVVAMYSDSNAIFQFKSNVEFVTWLFQKKHRGLTCIAHNGAKYDMHFIKREMIRLELKSKDICSGSSIFYMSMQQKSMRFIDSFKFIPMALRHFPETFGLKEMSKGYFPYRFLTKETLTYVGQYPDLSWYDFQYMKGKEYTQALAWYESQKHKLFDMESIILTYCMSDVRLLKEGCLEFRRLFLSATQDCVDPFDHITIASTCLTIYRMLDMPTNAIAKLHDNSEDVEERNWVVYYLNQNYNFDETNDSSVEHLTEPISYNVNYNISDPYRIRLSAVIGDMDDFRNCTVLLYLDCLGSGCTMCHRRTHIHPKYMITMRELLFQVEHTLQQIRRDCDTVIVMRRCEWMTIKKTQKITDDVITAPLRMRDGFFGGRTEPIKLYKECGTEKIGYVDFTSLYPSVQSGYYRDVITGEGHRVKYPIGHPVRPDVLYPNPSLYFGFMKVSISVPLDAYHSILPVRMDGKLVFPVGELKGTWTTIELEEAVKHGAVINHVYDVQHFPESTEALFSSYVSRFMKIKIEAGGWGKAKIDVNDKNAQREFIRNNKNWWGIDINPESMGEFNPGLYYISKLALNSLWGKFAQRPDLGKCQDTYNVKDFNEICFNPKNTVSCIFFHDTTARTVKYKTRTHQDEEVCNTNIAVAAFTTAHARLRLYRVIHHLGPRCLYYDTDSVIYSYNDTNQLQAKPYLGDFTNELDPGDYITTFISTGPKSYGYITANGKSCVKVKGFSLNIKNSQVINFDSMKSLIFDKEKLKVSTMQFNINDDHNISTVMLDRTLQFTSNKREIIWPEQDFTEVDSRPLIIV